MSEGAQYDRVAVQVWLEAQGMRVILDGSKRVVGVELMQNGEAVRVKVTKEVVLCCGTVMTPVVLMNSGIGPRVRCLPEPASCLDHVSLVVIGPLGICRGSRGLPFTGGWNQCDGSSPCTYVLSC